MKTNPAVENLLAQMRVTAAQAGLRQTEQVNQPPKADFGNVLKAQIDEVAAAQASSKAIQEAFVLGDDKVSLSDTMVEMQKSSVKFQMAVQVRNKAIQAYSDIMNMQV